MLDLHYHHYIQIAATDVDRTCFRIDGRMVNDALLKANGTAAVKDMNYALLASRPTMFGNEPHTQQTN